MLRDVVDYGVAAMGSPLQGGSDILDRRLGHGPSMPACALSGCGALAMLAAALHGLHVHGPARTDPFGVAASVAMPALAAALCGYLSAFGPHRPWMSRPHLFLRMLGWPSALLACAWAVRLGVDFAGGVSDGTWPSAWHVANGLGHVSFALAVALAACDRPLPGTAAGDRAGPAVGHAG